MSRHLDHIKALAQRSDRTWFRMAAEPASSTARVDLFDEIGYFGVTAQDFVRQLNALDVESIELHVNSPGGDVFDGIAITNALRQHKATVTAIVDGLAASAASFIAVGGADVVQMAPNSEMMVHDASGLCLGNAGDMQKMAGDLARISNNIASMYAARSGGTVEAWREVMLAETWYSAEEAVSAGLADEVLAEPARGRAPAKPADSFDLSVFAHAGRRDAPAPRTPVASASGPRTTSTQEGSSIVAFSDEQLNTLRQVAEVAPDADEATILAAIEDKVTAPAPQPSNTARAIPEGMVLANAEALARLQADAAAGRAAHDRQMADEQARIVDAAIAEGKIYARQRDAFMNLMKLDPAGTAANLKQAESIIPLSEVGHASNDLTVEVDDSWFPQFTATTGQER